MPTKTEFSRFKCSWQQQLCLSEIKLNLVLRSGLLHKSNSDDLILSESVCLHVYMFVNRCSALLAGQHCLRAARNAVAFPRQDIFPETSYQLQLDRASSTQTRFPLLVLFVSLLLHLSLLLLSDLIKNKKWKGQNLSEGEACQVFSHCWPGSQTKA